MDVLTLNTFFALTVASLSVLELNTDVSLKHGYCNRHLATVSIFLLFLKLVAQARRERAIFFCVFLSPLFALCLSPSLCLSLTLSLTLSLSLSPSVCLSVCLSACLSVRLSVDRSVCFSVCLYSVRTRRTRRQTKRQTPKQKIQTPS